jgi:hypothetical protein
MRSEERMGFHHYISPYGLPKSFTLLSKVKEEGKLFFWASKTPAT